MNKTYVVEMMTKRDFMNYMGGGYAYTVEKVEIVADTVENAIAIAEQTFTDVVINKNYVKTVDELTKEEEERVARVKAEEEKKATAKAKREQTELNKATALGLTVEEYRKEIAKERKIRTMEKKIAEMENELARMKKNLENIKNRG